MKLKDLLYIPLAIIALSAFLLGVSGIIISRDQDEIGQNLIGANTVFQGYQGGTGIGTTSAASVGKVVTVASTSPFLTYTLAAGAVADETDPIWNASSSAYLTTTTAASTYVARNDWTTIDDYPTACATGVVTGIGDTLTCTATSTLGISSQWTTSGSDIYYDTGSVSIGTSTAGYGLNVDGTANFTGAVTGIALNEIEDLTTSKVFALANNNLEFNFKTPAGHAFELSQDTGNPDAGTHLLHIYAEDPDVLPAHIVHIGSPTPGYFMVSSSSSIPAVGDVFLIGGTGNVGIGSSTPTYKLSVDGTIAATGDIVTQSILSTSTLTVNSAAGQIATFRSGNGSGSQAGANVKLIAGNGSGPGYDGGGVDITAGNGAGSTSFGGEVLIKGGTGGSLGVGGGITLTPGDASLGSAGQVSIFDPISGIRAKFNTTLLSATNKEFTFPNTSGTLVIGGGTASSTNTGDETTSTIGVLINGSTETTTPSDADRFAFSISSVLQYVTWSNIKATLKTYFDTLYGAITGQVWTGTHDFGGATALEVPNSTNVQTPTAGQVGIDTTSGQFRFNGGSATTTLVGFQSPSITIASTSWATTSTTTIPIGVAMAPETWSTIVCFTDTATTTVQFGDGTNWMTAYTATTTPVAATVSSNNAFTLLEKRYIRTYSFTGDPNYLSCSIKKTYDSD